MKKSILVFVLFIISKIVFAQKQDLIGAWHWSNDKNEIWLYIKKDSSIAKHEGLKGTQIWKGNAKEGKISLNNNILSIFWVDKTIEKHLIQFTDKNGFKLTSIESGIAKKKSKLQFYRVVDEEVIESNN